MATKYLASSAPLLVGQTLDKLKQSLNLQKVISLSHPLVLVTLDRKVLRCRLIIFVSFTIYSYTRRSPFQSFLCPFTGLRYIARADTSRPTLHWNALAPWGPSRYSTIAQGDSSRTSTSTLATYGKWQRKASLQNFVLRYPLSIIHSSLLTTTFDLLIITLLSFAGNEPIFTPLSIICPKNLSQQIF